MRIRNKKTGIVYKQTVKEWKKILDRSEGGKYSIVEMLMEEKGALYEMQGRPQKALEYYEAAFIAEPSDDIAISIARMKEKV